MRINKKSERRVDDSSFAQQNYPLLELLLDFFTDLEEEEPRLDVFLASVFFAGDFVVRAIKTSFKN